MPKSVMMTQLRPGDRCTSTARRSRASAMRHTPARPPRVVAHSPAKAGLPGVYIVIAGPCRSTRGGGVLHSMRNRAVRITKGIPFSANATAAAKSRPLDRSSPRPDRVAPLRHAPADARSPSNFSESASERGRARRPPRGPSPCAARGRWFRSAGRSARGQAACDHLPSQPFRGEAAPGGSRTRPAVSLPLVER